MLRASSDATGNSIDLDLISGGADDAPGSREELENEVPHAELLTRFVDAAVGESGDLSAVRAELTAATDEATMVDTAAVVAAFEMMTRVADGTGTAHPRARLDGIEDVREALGLDEFESARLLDH